jgi:hypothetical protein
MNDRPYSNREIDDHFEEVKEILARIEAQTTKTNGRVTKIEQWIEFAKGAVAITTLILVPIIGFLALQVYNLAVEH